MFDKLKKEELALSREMTQKHLDFEKKQSALNFALNFMNAVDNNAAAVIDIARSAEKFFNAK